MKIFVWILAVIIIVGGGIFGYGFYKTGNIRNFGEKLDSARGSLGDLEFNSNDNLDQTISSWENIKSKYSTTIVPVLNEAPEGDDVAKLKLDIANYYDVKLNDHIKELKAYKYFSDTEEQIGLEQFSNQQDGIKAFEALKTRLDTIMASSGQYPVGPELNSDLAVAQESFSAYYKSVNENYITFKAGGAVNIDNSVLHNKIGNLRDRLSKSIGEYVGDQGDINSRIKDLKNTKFSW